MKILGIIPSRYDSSRFPGKPLAKIQGKTMVNRVYEQALKARLLSDVIVATDHEEIYDHVKSTGGNVVMTSPDHENGTSRCGEAYRSYGQEFDFVINIQGDEPFIQPQQIDLLAEAVNSKDVQIATLIKKIEEEEELMNPGVVKVVFDKNDKAIYFSRSTIPFLRDTLQSQWLTNHDFYKHIGIYAYRTDVLDTLSELPMGNLQKAENLEQLGWIENGYSIKTAITSLDSHGIDTPQDLEKVNRDLEQQKLMG